MRSTDSQYRIQIAQYNLSCLHLGVQDVNGCLFNKINQYLFKKGPISVPFDPHVKPQTLDHLIRRE